MFAIGVFSDWQYSWAKQLLTDNPVVPPLISTHPGWNPHQLITV